MSSDAGTGNWCLIESDPGVFTELIRGFDCTGVQVEELYSLDAATFEALKPVYGLVFLFKWRPGDTPSGSVVKDSRLGEIFFAQQVIQNACATQALVNLLLNCEGGDDLKLGPTLTEFKNFTAGFDPPIRGLCLSNSESIRKVHNGFARQNLFELDLKLPDKDDNYHFITYCPIKGRVYELDGLQDGPIDVGQVAEGGDWLDIVRPVIEARIKKYSEGEIHFNLMAVVGDRRIKYQRQLDQLTAQSEQSPNVAEEICHIQMLISDEEQKFERYRTENRRRKHNYMPFIVELMKILAKEGKLVPLVKQAKEKALKKSEEEAKQKKSSAANA